MDNNDIAVTEGAASDTDNLVISLDSSIKNLRYYSKFNLVHTVLVTATFFLTKILYIYYSASPNMALYVSSLFWLLISFRIIDDIRSSRKDLLLYKNGATGFIKLDNNGIEFPPTILVDVGSKHDLINAGHIIIKLLWGDITDWHIYNGSKNFPKCYILSIKNAIPTPNGEHVAVNGFMIQRCLSNKEEKQLLDFAQRFLDIPIQKWSPFGLKPIRYASKAATSARSA